MFTSLFSHQGHQITEAEAEAFFTEAEHLPYGIVLVLGLIVALNTASVMAMLVAV